MAFHPRLSRQGVSLLMSWMLWTSLVVWWLRLHAPQGWWGNIFHAAWHSLPLKKKELNIVWWFGVSQLGWQDLPQPLGASLRYQLCGCCAESLQSCPALCDPMDCSLPGSSVRGTSQARVLEWVAVPSSGDLPHPGIEPTSHAVPGGILTTSATWEACQVWAPWENSPEPPCFLTAGYEEKLGY